jgi:hypothetical protein
MQAPTRDLISEARAEGSLSITVPASLRERLEQAMAPLFERLPSPGLLKSTALGHADAVKVTEGADGWRIETPRGVENARSDDAVLLRLQELVLEGAVASRNQILFRGSIVSRGSQSVLIVGDQDAWHVVLAVAMTALEFQFVSVGLAAFDACRLAPIPLPLLVRLDAADRAALRLVPGQREETLEQLGPDLFRPRSVIPASELSHVLFPEARHGRLSMVRPIASTAARARLCQALAAAPHDLSPFAAVAALLRHARGVHVTVGEPPQAIEQLARLLPRWCVTAPDAPD